MPQDNLNITLTKATAPIRAKATAMARAGLLTGKFGLIARRRNSEIHEPYILPNCDEKAEHPEKIKANPR
jgi:hypothetical protein